MGYNISYRIIKYTGLYEFIGYVLVVVAVITPTRIAPYGFIIQRICQYIAFHIIEFHRRKIPLLLFHCLQMILCAAYLLFKKDIFISISFVRSLFCYVQQSR